MSTIAGEVKNEHYVPRRYLKYFANNKAFYVFDKEKEQIRPGSIEDYASERYFYDVDFEALKKDILDRNPDFVFDAEIEALMDEIDEQHLEKWFGEYVETDMFNPIEKIITKYVMTNPDKLDQVEAVTDSELDLLSFYVAIQLVRSKEFRKYLVEMNERVPLLLMKKNAQQTNDTELLKYLNQIKLKVPNKNYEKLLHAQILMDEEMMLSLAEMFRNKIWTIGYNTTNIDFLTSDNPIVRYGHLRSHGLNSEGIEIAFPISTRLIICMRDAKYFWFDQELHKHFYKMNEEEIDFYNSFQVLQSYRYVFGKTDKFEKVDDIIKRRPELKDINRNKILMG